MSKCQNFVNRSIFLEVENNIQFLICDFFFFFFRIWHLANNPFISNSVLRKFLKIFLKKIIQPKFKHSKMLSMSISSFTSRTHPGIITLWIVKKTHKSAFNVGSTSIIQSTISNYKQFEVIAG
jgi:hypothetical protein